MSRPAYNFTQHAKAPSGASVSIDPVARYGYWEHADGTEGGGLWFDPQHGPRAEGLDLVDFDGDFELPKGVPDAIRSLGHTVDADYDA